MSLSWAGCYKNPGDLAQKLTFTKDGLIIWQSIAEITCMKFLWRGYPSNFKREQIDEALKSQTKTCLLNVDNGNHWVLGIYRVPLTNKYWVADPFYGTRRFYSGVIGYAILQKK